MVTTTISDAQADLYLDGIAKGMELATAYDDEDGAEDSGTWIYLGRTTMVLIRTLVVLGIIGWTLGILQMAGIGL